MNYTYYLIVGKSGFISTVATEQQFEKGVFMTNADKFNTYKIVVTDSDLAWLSSVWDHCDVVGPGLPITDVSAITDPTSEYLRLIPADNSAFTIERVELPFSLILAYHADLRIKQLETAYERAKVGRFSSGATGAERWYDGKDFLQFAMPFVFRGQTDFFTCAESETGDWITENHTIEQIQAVGVSFTAWYGALRQRFQDLQAQVRAATSLTEQQGVVW